MRISTRLQRFVCVELCVFASRVIHVRLVPQLYFFTVEFGLCRQPDGTFRVYGAGLLSSVAELQHALTAHEKIQRFDPEVTCREECIITAYQNAYYYTDSFEEAKDQMRKYADSIQRPFGVRYNPYTQSVEVLSSAKRITAVVCELRGDLSLVSSALRKVSAMDHDLNVDMIAEMLQTGLNVGGGGVGGVSRGGSRSGSVCGGDDKSPISSASSPGDSSDSCDGGGGTSQKVNIVVSGEDIVVAAAQLGK